MKRVKTESHEETPIDLPTVEFATTTAPNGDTTVLPPSPPVPNSEYQKTCISCKIYGFSV